VFVFKAAEPLGSFEIFSSRTYRSLRLATFLKLSNYKKEVNEVMINFMEAILGVGDFLILALSYLLFLALSYHC